MIDATKEHPTVIQLIVDLWELNFPKHDCFDTWCRDEYKFNADSLIHEKILVPLPAETLAGIVEALQRAGFSLEEIRELLMARRHRSPDKANDNDMVNGLFSVGRCVGPLSLVDALRKRHPSQ